MKAEPVLPHRIPVAMKHVAGATALALLLSACSGENPAPPTEGETATAAPEPEGTPDASASTADDAIDGMAAGTDAGDAGAAAAPTGTDRGEVDAIPDRFRGTWASSSEECGARSFNRLTIAADRVNFFEDGGFASDIRVNGNALAVTYPFETPDGATESRVVYFARETQDRMRVRQGSGESATYVRCPAQ